MTDMLFRDDPYLRAANGKVTAHTPEGGIVLDQTVFYPTGGGQPGDNGTISWPGNRIEIATAVKGEGDDIILIPAEPRSLPPVGSHVEQSLDWERRHGHMRVHTALHLLSVIMPFGVTGGSISATKGRLDFAMDDAPENRDEMIEILNDLVSEDLPVADEWIDEAELDANPGLVKTLRVAPPRGKGPVRLIRIGRGDETVDLQPCGGTHVARTGEIGTLRLGKIEKKGRMNRRINIHIDS